MGFTNDETGLAQFLLDIIFGFLRGHPQAQITGDVYRSIIQGIFRDDSEKVSRM
jgi:hypothetical protein